VDDIFSRNIDGNGYIKSIVQGGTGNLNVNSGSESGSATRVVLADSLYGSYNWQTVGDLLVQGNIYTGGYFTVDSIVSSGDIWIQNNLGIGGNLSVYGGGVFYDTVSAQSELSVGSSGVTKGYIDFKSGLSFGRIRLTTPDISIGASLKILNIPSVTDGKTIGTIDGNQNYTDMGYIVPDSVQSDNNYEILYSDTKIAGASAGDTSANFTTFLNTTNGSETKVRFTYLHRRGNANIKAYYQIQGVAFAAVLTKLAIYTLAGALVTSATTNNTTASAYEEDSVTLPVSTLTTNQLYELRFITSGSGATDIPETKTLTIVATSN
jgi:hypothetical protein